MLKQKVEFDGLNGAVLHVGTAPGAVLLEIQEGRRSACIYLKPDDFGELAAAIWVCSPSGEPNATQLGIFRDQEENRASQESSERAKAQALKEAAD